ncbi:Anti-sigma factor [Pararobbsia alpina]|uniref:anti-sigma factor family protein n=1 Tax=Pararobbsia alpina TaxID=621374 RepID=UPI0039A6AB02
MDDNETSTLGTRLRDGSLYERAPVELRAQVRANLRAESQAALARQRRMWPSWVRLPEWVTTGWSFVGGGAAGAALCAFAFAFVVMPMSAEHSDLLMRDIVSSHVRAMMSDRAIDVESSDRQTVKPWFSEHLDYAPPVVDTVSQGFPLVGGRLDYVAQRPVAVMIYKYLKHSIDLYVFPDSHDVKSAPQAKTEDGFSIARWHQNGMTFCAITDASPVFLREFEQAIQAEVGR